MLNTAERFEILKVIRFWCKVGLLPIKVNLSTWELLPHAKKPTTWKCHFWFFLFVLHALYKIAALVYWLKVGIQLHQAVIHAMLAVLPPLWFYWYYFLYIQNPRLLGMYVNMTLTGIEDGYEGAVKSDSVRSWSRRLKECTFQDLFAMSLSYTLVAGCLAITFTFISDPSMKYLLYAALPKEHQTWITFGILLFEEMRLLSVMCSVAIPVLIVQVISFDLVHNQLQLLVNSMPRSGRIYRSLRRIQLYVGITNLINCNLIFSLKHLSLGIATGTGYAAIAHFGAYPLFGVMYYFQFLNTTFMYIFCYDKAFKIPALFQRVTQRARLVQHWDNTEVAKIFKREMRSFPRVGIKVGDFNMMERESTMNYIDFVLNNIVSLLVAYG